MLDPYSGTKEVISTVCSSESNVNLWQLDANIDLCFSDLYDLNAE